MHSLFFLFLWIFFWQVCGNLGKNSSHPQNFACSYTYVLICIHPEVRLPLYQRILRSDCCDKYPDSLYVFCTAYKQMKQGIFNAYYYYQSLFIFVYLFYTFVFCMFAEGAYYTSQSDPVGWRNSGGSRPITRGRKEKLRPPGKMCWT